MLQRRRLLCKLGYICNQHVDKSEISSRQKKIFSGQGGLAKRIVLCANSTIANMPGF